MPTMQTQNQRSVAWGKYLLILTLVLVANSAYLAAYGDPSLFYVTNALLHPVLGILTGALFIAYLKRNRELWRTLSGRIAVGLLAVAATYGIFLLFVGMTRPHSLALYAHVGFGIA